MSKTKDLTKFSAKQMQEFLMSFDIVMSDIDGVLWPIDGSPINGALESLKTLKNLGKQIYLVTNNSSNTIECYCEKTQRIDIKSNHIINTAKVIVWYLKKINFRNEVFALASEPFRNTLKEEGIQLVEDPKVFLEDVQATTKEVLDRPSVKAVIIDFDVTCNWAKLALAISCLKRKDVLYISGPLDEWLTSSNQIKILGPGPLVHLLTKQSGRKPILCAKPSEILKDYIVETCDVGDPQRCLFIGDTAAHDMKFASMCGFKKLLVGSGYSTLEEAQKNEDTYPDYYLPHLGQLFCTLEDPQCQQNMNNKNN